MRSVKAIAAALLRAAYIRNGSTGYTRCHVCGNVVSMGRKTPTWVDPCGHRKDCEILKLEKK